MRTAAPDRKRVVRFLGLLRKAPAYLETTATSEICLFRFEGERTVKCPIAILQTMERAGLVAREISEGDVLIRVTETGEAMILRSGKGGVERQHRLLRETVIETETGKQAVIVNDAESPLTTLARLKRPDGSRWLDGRELAAGERLRVDFERAVLRPRVTASWDLTRVTGGKGSGNLVTELSDRALSARGRLESATDAVGPELSGVLLDICCFLKGLEQVETERGWPRRSAKLLLKAALGALDRHYHPPARGGERSRPVLHWGADDYRPSLR